MVPDGGEQLAAGNDIPHGDDVAAAGDGNGAAGQNHHILNRMRLPHCHRCCCCRCGGGCSAHVPEFHTVVVSSRNNEIGGGGNRRAAAYVVIVRIPNEASAGVCG